MEGKNEEHKKYLLFGLKDEALIHVSQVENGLNCSCICPSCGAPLVAKNKGRQKIHHFAHASHTSCTTAVESVLHIFAKEIILEHKTLFIPHYKATLKYKFEESIILTINKTLSFDNVEIEKTFHSELGPIIVDAVGYIKDKILLVEFAKTHFVDENKLDKIKKIGHPCIEIDLAECDQSKEAVYEYLNTHTGYCKWLYNLKGLTRLNELNEIEERKFIQRKNESSYTKKYSAQWYNARDRYNEAKLKGQIDEANEELEIKKLGGTLVSTCPLESEIQQGFMQTQYASFDFIQSLLNGSEWNHRKIYYEGPDGIDIFIDGKQKILVPKEHEEDDYSLLKEKYPEYDAMCKYNEIFIKKSFCHRCKYFVRNYKGKILCRFSGDAPADYFFDYDMH